MPTLAGYLWFLRNIVEVPVPALPDDSPAIAWSFNMALAMVNAEIQCEIPLLYAVAINNFAADWLINWAPDQEGQTYFTLLRKSNRILSFVAGVINASADETDSQSFMVPDTFKNFGVQDLQNLKTQYGREYLAIAQQVGSLWGMS